MFRASSLYMSVLNLVGNLKVGFIMMWPYATIPPKSSMQVQSDLVNNPQHLKAGFLQNIYNTTLMARVHFRGYLRAIIDPNRDQFRGKVGTKIDARTIIEAGPF